MELKIVLIVIFVLTSFIAFLHFAKTHRNDSNIFFGLFISFFALSIIHVINVNIFFQTQYNPLVLLPLNLIFFPLYFIVRYFDKLLSFQIFNTMIEKAILIIAFVELSTNLLPLGAWIYTKKFDTQLILFIFCIKRFFVALLLPFSITILIILSKSIKKYIPKTTNKKLKIKYVREFIILLSVLVFVIQLPEIARFFKFQSFYLFIFQCAVGAAIIIFMGLRNLNIEVDDVIEITQEINIYNSETNRNFNLIKQLFENEKIYTNSELRIADIAEKVSLSPNYVSKIINENAKMGFNDFVNQYRVDEVIEKFKNKEHLQKNIFALAQEAGFKSKSTFQTVFKKVTEKTPTQFISAIETP